MANPDAFGLLLVILEDLTSHNNKIRTCKNSLKILFDQKVSKKL